MLSVSIRSWNKSCDIVEKLRDGLIAVVLSECLVAGPHLCVALRSLTLPEVAPGSLTLSYYLIIYIVCKGNTIFYILAADHKITGWIDKTRTFPHSTSTRHKKMCQVSTINDIRSSCRYLGKYTTHICIIRSAIRIVPNSKPLRAKDVTVHCLWSFEGAAV